MKMIYQLRRKGRSGLVIAAGVATLGVAGLVAADAVLHPGTLTGTFGLTHTDFSDGSEYLSISGGQFSANGSFTPGAFSLTTEGNQTYTSQYGQEYSYNSHTFYQFSSNASILIPGGGTVNRNFVRPGGQIVPHVGVNANGTVASIYAQVSGSGIYSGADDPNVTESYYSQLWPGDQSNDTAMSTIAGVNLSLYVRAQIQINDGSGNYLCTVSRAASVSQVCNDGSNQTCTADTDCSAGTCSTPINVTEGTALPIVQNFTVSPADCAYLNGTVNVSFPSGDTANYGYVYTNVYPGGQQWSFNNSNTTSYNFSLSAGTYNPYLYMQFSRPDNSSSQFYDYSGSPNVITLNSGDTGTIDWVYTGATAHSTLNITGPGQTLWNYKQQYFYSDSSVQAYSTTSAPTDNLAVNLHPGNWTKYYNFIQFYDPNPATYLYSYSYDYGHPSTFTATSGGTNTLPAETFASATADLTFDVIEPPNTPVIGITSPYFYAYKNDTVCSNDSSVLCTSDADCGAGNTCRQDNLQVYSYNQSANNVPTPSVRMVGRPGQYSIQAYGTVLGNNTAFAAASLTLGAPVVVTTGPANIMIDVNYGKTTSALNLNFQQVTSGGTTTVSTSSSGPALPTGFNLVNPPPPTNSSQSQPFILISTNATITGKVELTFGYDPTVLINSKTNMPMTLADQQRLVFMHYDCLDPVTNCPGWTKVNEVWNPHTPAYDATTPTWFGRNDPTFHNPDTTNHLLYGVVSHFSTFALAIEDSVLVPPTDTCVGTSAVRVELHPAAGTCGLSVDNTNQVAGGCSGGGGGLASCTFDGSNSESLSLGNKNISILGTAVDTSTATCTSYVTLVDREKPGITCAAPVTVECAGPTTPATETATCTDNCGTCSASCGSGPYPLGTNSVACNAVDGNQNTSSCTTQVIVKDTKAPVLSVSASPATLWPPNGKMVPITLVKNASDKCDSSPVVTCSATSNEPGGASDIVWQGNSLSLREDRLGTGTGRVYTITCVAKDASGNKTTATTTVKVPHDQGH